MPLTDALGVVVIAVEIHEPMGFGRISFVRANVEPGSRVRTDGAAVYRDLTDLGYAHERTVHLGSQVPANVSMVGVHRVAALLTARCALRCIDPQRAPGRDPSRGACPGSPRISRDQQRLTDHLSHRL